jgi:hypothetical protein
MPALPMGFSTTADDPRNNGWECPRAPKSAFGRPRRRCWAARFRWPCGRGTAVRPVRPTAPFLCSDLGKHSGGCCGFERNRLAEAYVLGEIDVEGDLRAGLEAIWAAFSAPQSPEFCRAFSSRVTGRWFSKCRAVVTSPALVPSSRLTSLLTCICNRFTRRGSSWREPASRFATCTRCGSTTTGPSRRGGARSNDMGCRRGTARAGRSAGVAALSGGGAGVRARPDGRRPDSGGQAAARRSERISVQPSRLGASGVATPRNQPVAVITPWESPERDRHRPAPPSHPRPRLASDRWRRSGAVR